MGAIVFLFLWLGPAAWAASIANKKGRSQAGFFFLSLAIGWFGLLFAALAKPDHQAVTGDRRPCPHCSEPIMKTAKVCRYCGRDVAPSALPRVAIGDAVGMRCHNGHENPLGHKRCAVCDSAFLDPI